MSESLFHHFVLSIIGVTGILWFYATDHLPKVWSQPRRVFVGTMIGLVYLVQAMSAFDNLSNASSMEIVGFIGCILGCLGAARMMNNTPTSPRDGATSAKG